MFLSWYKNEGENPNWANLAKERGFASWADWRLKGYAQRFKCAKAEWGFYEISDPSVVVSGWFGGPFRTWIERHYGGEKTKSFAELAGQPDIAENPTIKAMATNYPRESIISALQVKDGRVFVVEGSHRSCALVVMAKNGRNFPDKLIFAIGKSTLSELPPVGQNTLQ
ncbi:MAG: hypothetical protein CO003_01645 [Candidatus Portnoybacteria bacterium CG_4_8_14_3_um_filter_44_15]|uniref:Uncharacterized protein n=1 Tax=Candidatus Portnoybacteria bacterium CG_4_8_14_3_um_filter_44_15 TaxID=1974803 RepID=A0A2M7IDQ0_9BACT|nr:MAG: hypothetical protein CO003_01645 [Candidatus Portnoybacteria bacterium CG_4_8_14_3_um_filter_44_15]